VYNKINVENHAIMDYHWSDSLADIHFSPLKTLFRNHIIRNTSPSYFRISSTVRDLKRYMIYIYYIEITDIILFQPRVLHSDHSKLRFVYA